MNGYIDASVLLRIVFGQRDVLQNWEQFETPFSTELIRVEGLRAIDRARLRGELDETGVDEHRTALVEQLTAFQLIALEGPVLARAAEPFWTALGTLDALHLATALLARGELGDFPIATHDDELARAARAEGFEVYGV